MPGKKTTIKGQANQRLQEERLRHRWTQQEVANRVGTTVVNVSRWERGVTSPGPYFRQQLSLLFAKNEEALGLGSDEGGNNERETLERTESIRDSRPMQSEERLQAERTTPVQIEQSPQLEIEPLPGTLTGQPTPVVTVTHRRVLSTHRTRWAIGLSAAFIVLVTGNILLFPLIYAHATSGTRNIASTSIQSIQSSIKPVLTYSFEDGGIDGWTKAGHIVQFQNSSAVGGYDGTHALQVVFSSRKSTDLPYISVNPIISGPNTGETLSSALFIPATNATLVAAKLYVQDITYRWYPSPVTLLTKGKWNVLRFVVPRFAGSALQVGIQFLSTPPGILTTLYADDIEWW